MSKASRGEAYPAMKRNQRKKIISESEASGEKYQRNVSENESLKKKRKHRRRKRKSSAAMKNREINEIATLEMAYQSAKRLKCR
jgi:hypothetical protein